MAKEENGKKSASKKSGTTKRTTTSKSGSSAKKKKSTQAANPTVGDVVTTAVKSASKSNSTFVKVLVLLLVVAIVGLCIYGYFAGWFDAILHPDTTPSGFNSQTYNAEVIKNEDLSIHFLETGNWNTGDCIYIKVGQTDILIDAGSTRSSADTIDNYIKQYCTDGKLEYVVATHAHEDHIAGFVGTNTVSGIFDRYKCDNLIQFARNNTDSKLYKDYVDKVDNLRENGTNVYTALQCWNNEGGAKRKYQLTNDVSMEVLYQKYYENNSSTENNYSVCLLFRQGNNNYLFTGDLEKAGEESLVDSNTLPQCVLYKAGHHGSKTSSHDKMLSAIKPQIVCVCCCAGTDEYTKEPANMFPTQDFVDRIAPYTDKVYVTTLGKENKTFESMNGNIVYGCSYKEVNADGDTAGATDGTTRDGKTAAVKGYVMNMYFSANDTKLKDTDWFKNNRTMPEAWKKDEAAQ